VSLALHSQRLCVAAHALTVGIVGIDMAPCHEEGRLLSPMCFTFAGVPPPALALALALAQSSHSRACAAVRSSDRIARIALVFWPVGHPGAHERPSCLDRAELLDALAATGIRAIFEGDFTRGARAGTATDLLNGAKAQRQSFPLSWSVESWVAALTGLSTDDGDADALLKAEVRQQCAPPPFPCTRTALIRIGWGGRRC
jgi:hypothetical protein